MADVLERLKKLDEERSKLLDAAKKEALSKAEAAVADLNALGFEYRLVEGTPAPAASTRKGTRQVKDGPCPTCGFKTNPLHDARRHRSQTEKRPFTPAELKEMGLEKIA